MIVQTHSPEQVVREALRDLPAMWNKMKDPLARLQRRMRVDKSLRMVPQLLEYRSPQGNNWLVAILPTKKVLTIAPFVYYRGTDGYYRAARVVQDGVCYHISHHVLEQYAERFNRTSDGLARLKEFIRENMCFGTEYCRDNDDVRVGVTHGYIIGTWVVPHRWRSSSPSWTMASCSPINWNRWTAWTNSGRTACARYACLATT